MTIFGRLMRAVMRRRLRRGLSAVRIEGLERLRALSARGPLLLCANHVSFWDGFLCALIADRLGLDARALMLASQLQAMPMLRHAGGVGVDLADPRDGARAIRLAARLLDRPGRALWLFPQGAQRPQWARPLGFRRGAELIARLAPGALVVPVALHYELSEGERPEAHVALGELLPRGAPIEQLEAAVVELLEGIKGGILAGAPAPSIWERPRRLGQGPASRLLSALLR